MASSKIDNLKEYLVQEAPPSIYYIPNFISPEEEQLLLNKVYSSPKPKWTQLSHRKLQNWGGLPHPKGMIPESLPDWLQKYAEKIAALGIFEDKVPNHVLVNEYLPGQGIMPHEDGPLFYPTVSTISLGSHTVLDFYYHLNKEDQTENVQSTSTSSENNPGVLGEPTSTSFRDRYFLSILLEPRSLILVCNDMYKIHLHGIEERTEDFIDSKVANLSKTSVEEGACLVRSTRVSLTIRYVPKILKAKLSLFKR